MRVKVEVVEEERRILNEEERKSEKEKDFPSTNFYKLPHHNSAELIILHSEN